MDQIKFIDHFVTIFGIKGIDDYETRIYSSQFTAPAPILERINDLMPEIKALFQASQLQLSRTNYQVENMTVVFGLLKNLLRQANIPYDIIKSNSRTYLQLKPPNNALREYIETKMESICTPEFKPPARRSSNPPVIDLREFFRSNPPTQVDLGYNANESNDSILTRHVHYMLEHNLDSIQYTQNETHEINTIGFLKTRNMYYILIRLIHTDVIFNPECKLIINNRVVDCETRFFNNYYRVEYSDVQDKYFPAFPASAYLLVFIDPRYNELLARGMSPLKMVAKISYDAILLNRDARPLLMKSKLKINDTETFYHFGMPGKNCFDDESEVQTITTESAYKPGIYGYNNIYDIQCKLLNHSGALDYGVIEQDGEVIDSQSGLTKDLNFSYWTEKRFIPMAYNPYSSVIFKFMTDRPSEPHDFVITYKIKKPTMEQPKIFKFLDAKGRMRYGDNHAILKETSKDEIPDIYELEANN